MPLYIWCVKVVKILLLLLAFSVRLPANAAEHPFYVSITEIHIKPSQQLVQLSCRMFTDDLEDALRRLNGVPADLLVPKDEATVNALLNAYVQARVQVQVNGVPQQLQFIGYESDEEAVWVHFEGKLTETPGRVDINNSLLFDFLPGQTNMVHCYLDEKRQSTKLDCPERKAAFQW